MTSYTVSRNNATSDADESQTHVERRIADVKEAYIDGEITEGELEELLEAALDEEPPYLASVIREDDKSMEISPPPDKDEVVYRNRSKFYTIDGNLAREREPPGWENVFNVTGEGRGPDFDEVRVIEQDNETPREAQLKQEELRDRIL